MADLTSKPLTLDSLRQLVEGDAVAIRGTAILEPAGGSSDKVFPPTHSVRGKKDNDLWRMKPDERHGIKYASRDAADRWSACPVCVARFRTEPGQPDGGGFAGTLGKQAHLTTCHLGRLFCHCTGRRCCDLVDSTTSGGRCLAARQHDRWNAFPIVGYRQILYRCDGEECCATVQGVPNRASLWSLGQHRAKRRAWLQVRSRTCVRDHRCRCHLRCKNVKSYRSGKHCHQRRTCARCKGAGLRWQTDLDSCRHGRKTTR